MCEKPYHLEPGFEETSMRGSDPRDVRNYSDCITHETLRVAVVMMVREGPQHMLMSPMLRSVVRVSAVTLIIAYRVAFPMSFYCYSGMRCCMYSVEYVELVYAAPCEAEA
jgi:hypothetical protein